MFRFILLVTLVTIATAQPGAREDCNEFLDVMIMVDGSSSVGPSIESYRGGLRNLVSRMDIRGATATTKVQLGICYFGTEGQEVVPLSTTNTRESVTRAINVTVFPGGRTSYHQGIDCVERNFQRNARAGAKQVVVFVVDGNPDRNTRVLADEAVNRLKGRGVIISLIAIAQQFVNKEATFRFASDRQLAFPVDDFSQFQSSTNEFFSAVCPQQFIPTTTTTPAPTTTRRTTTTTTTPRPTRQQAPCDNCKIVNGVGYAAAEDCYHYYQCILQDDETWLEFRRPVAVGSYWDQRRITLNDPALAACPQDPCQGQSDGAVLGGYDNCRALIRCIGGVSAFVECCPEGQANVNGECRPDANCVDDCNPFNTSPGVCYLSPDVNGDVGRFMANDGDFSLSMPCSIGTRYSDVDCGCVHAEEPIPVRECRDHPEVRLEFGADGQVRDISRNLYTVTSFGFSTFETSQGSGVYGGSFNGSSGLRISNANMGLGDGDGAFTVRVVYTSQGNVQNAAVVSDAECVNTLRTVAIMDDNRAAAGFIRTIPNQDVTVRSQITAQRKEVVMQYNGQDLVLNTNGQVQSSAAGVLLARSNFCDGTHIGFSNDAPSFIGDVFEFEIYKCIGEGSSDFQRTP